MTNFPPPTLRVAPPALTGRRRGVATGLGPIFLTLTVTFAVSLALGSGCQQRAGMPCQQPSDCTPGLLCNKPPMAGAQGYGVCEPGLKGIGERCISSVECSVGLICSTDVGDPSADGWHGACEVSPLKDGSASDLSGADLGSQTD